MYVQVQPRSAVVRVSAEELAPDTHATRSPRPELSLRSIDHVIAD